MSLHVPERLAGESMKAYRERRAKSLEHARTVRVLVGLDRRGRPIGSHANEARLHRKKQQAQHPSIRQFKRQRSQHLREDRDVLRAAFASDF